MIILDTDIAIDILRKHPPALAWISSVKDRVCLPGFVVLELQQGCKDKRQVLQLEKQLSQFAILWPSDAECDVALAHFPEGRLTHALGLLDVLIAAVARTHGQPLHTFNQKH